MKSLNNIPKYQFEAICERRAGQPKGFMLCKILKSGKLGKPQFHKAFHNENTAEELIANLEEMNQGQHWVVA